MIRRLLLKFNIEIPPFPSPPPAHQPERVILYQLGGLIFIAVISHFYISNIIIGLLTLLIFILKMGLLRSGKATLPKFVVMLLTISSLGLILILYGGWNGQRAGISFLVLLVSLKFLESRTLRDYYVVCLILYFLGASSFLFNSSLLNITVILIYTMAITGMMLKLSSPSPINWSGSLSSASSILAKALPLAILLFFFFPRIHGSFGFIPSQDENQFDNELNNTLVAGEMAASAFNNSLAFRVEFDGDIPKQQQLYWRSKVMPVENNFQWSVRAPRSNQIINAQRKADLASLDKGDVHYTILHEDSSDLFLPYLDYVVGYSKGNLLDDYSVWINKETIGSFSYQGASTGLPSLPETTENITELLQTELLQTQSTPSARTAILLTKWLNKTSNHFELVQLALDHFRHNNFRYSLLPPNLGNDPVDEFLFDTQTGYCEHYASVFTTLMRWLHIPARVVVGYQGGQYNQSGRYLEVRYSDAHAWSEVWINQQWHRVDPTATISPDRIDFGMNAFMAMWDGLPISAYDSARSKSLANFLNPGGVERYYRRLKDNWSNVGYQWNKWVVNYDMDKQKQLLAKLGVDSRNSTSMLIAILFASACGLMLFYFWRLMPKPIKLGEAQQTYLQFVQRFKRHQISKDLADTPTEFADKTKLIFPHLSQEIDKITNSYIDLRYGREPADLKMFKQRVKQFKLGPKLSLKQKNNNHHEAST